jgi:hypothetical protein
MEFLFVVLAKGPPLFSYFGYYLIPYVISLSLCLSLPVGWPLQATLSGYYTVSTY